MSSSILDKSGIKMPQGKILFLMIESKVLLDQSERILPEEMEIAHYEEDHSASHVNYLTINSGLLL